MTSREVTNYLKGFAILFIPVNHYINSYSSLAISGYANGMVALFFVLSGYGNYYALGKFERINLSTILRYLVKRAVRIYPLYWLSLLLSYYLRGGQYTWEHVLALPTSPAPGLYWFITYLVQCYLLAPFLFLLLKKLGSIRYTLVISIIWFLVYMVYPFTSLPFSRDMFIFRLLFLGHVLLFALGMALPSIIQEYGTRFEKKVLVAVFFLVFLLMVHLTHHPDLLFHRSGVYLALVYIAASYFLCLFAFSSQSWLPLQRVLITLGIYSY
jgi:peptidoglycan/LPS O-acetylase OafA/YrhL